MAVPEYKPDEVPVGGKADFYSPASTATKKQEVKMGWLNSDSEGERLAQVVELCLQVLILTLCVFIGVVFFICFSVELKSLVGWVQGWMFG